MRVLRAASAFSICVATLAPANSSRFWLAPRLARAVATVSIAVLMASIAVVAAESALTELEPIDSADLLMSAMSTSIESFAVLA